VIARRNQIGRIRSQSASSTPLPIIVVYDLEPGAVPVLHRAREEKEPPVDFADAHSQTDLTESNVHSFIYEPAGEDRVVIGMWSPAIPADSTVVRLMFHQTDDPEEADQWRAELSSGHLPLMGESS
jgi:hypothetical protein